MKSVAAFREQPQRVFRLEFRQADGAVKRIPHADDRAVVENGESVDEGLVEAGVVEVEELLELAFHRGKALRFAGASPQQESHEEVEQSGDEEDHCDYYDG